MKPHTFSTGDKVLVIIPFWGTIAGELSKRQFYFSEITEVRKDTICDTNGNVFRKDTLTGYYGHQTDYSMKLIESREQAEKEREALVKEGYKDAYEKQGLMDSLTRTFLTSG